jgi:hypothetical protein
VFSPSFASISPLSGAFILVFWLFLAKRTQLVFFLNLFIPKPLRSFSVGSFGKKRILYREIPANRHLDPSGHRSLTPFSHAANLPIFPEIPLLYFGRFGRFGRGIIYLTQNPSPANVRP